MQRLSGNILLAGGGSVVALFIASAVVAPLGVFLPWVFRRTSIAFGGEKVAWSLASDINVDRQASRNAELRMVFLPQAWAAREWQHNFYYQDPKLVADLAERLTHWAPRPSRIIDIEALILGAMRLAFQLAILAAFARFALFLTLG